MSVTNCHCHQGRSDRRHIRNMTELEHVNSEIDTVRDRARADAFERTLNARRGESRPVVTLPSFRESFPLALSDPVDSTRLQYGTHPASTFIPTFSMFLSSRSTFPPLQPVSQDEQTSRTRTNMLSVHSFESERCHTLGRPYNYSDDDNDNDTRSLSSFCEDSHSVPSKYTLSQNICSLTRRSGSELSLARLDVEDGYRRTLFSAGSRVPSPSVVSIANKCGECPSRDGCHHHRLDIRNPPRYTPPPDGQYPVYQYPPHNILPQRSETCNPGRRYKNRSHSPRVLGRIAGNNSTWLRYATEARDEDGTVFYMCLWNHNSLQCDYTAQKQAMKRHVETTHLKYKPHGCSYCHRAYSQKTALGVHEATHTGATPHACRYECGKSFSDPARRYRHHVRYHGYVPKKLNKKHRRKQ